MGFGGATAAMIASLKNNLREIRTKIKTENRIVTIKVIVLTTISIIVVFTLTFFLLKSEATQLLFNP